MRVEIELMGLWTYGVKTAREKRASYVFRDY
jgi:hypothetical protein